VHAARNLVYHHNPSIINGIEGLGRELYARLQAVVVVSADAKRYQTEIGVPVEKIHVVANGIDLSVFSPGSVARHNSRLLLVGSVADYKGADIVLRAFRDLKVIVPSAELHVYGANHAWQNSTDWLRQEGFMAPDGTIEWSAVEAREPGVKYCGEATSAELAVAYRSASVLVSGTRIPETSGLVAVEAQACGCIPVLPNHGGMPETVKANETGLLYRPCDSEDLTTRLIHLLQEAPASVLSQMRNEAATWVAGRFSWRRAAKEFERVVLHAPAHGWKDSMAAAYYRTGRQIRDALRLSRVRRVAN
jgi:glycosyltransferase involved in cell wall biosynthesis